MEANRQPVLVKAREKSSWQELRAEAARLKVQRCQGLAQAVRVLRATRDAYLAAQEAGESIQAVELLVQALAIKAAVLGGSDTYVQLSRQDVERCSNTVALWELRKGRVGIAEHVLLQQLSRRPLGPAKSILETNLGICKYYSGDYSGAIECWESLRSPSPYSQLAISAARYKEGNISLAMKHALESVESCHGILRKCNITQPLSGVRSEKLGSFSILLEDAAVVTALAYLGLAMCCCHPANGANLYTIGLRLLRRIYLEIVCKTPTFPMPLGQALWLFYVERCSHGFSTNSPEQTIQQHYELLLAQKQSSAVIIQRFWKYRNPPSRRARFVAENKLVLAATTVQRWLRMKSVRAHYWAFRQLAAQADSGNVAS